MGLTGPVKAGEAEEPFTYRGYYIILSRNPVYGLSDWKVIMDCMAEDRCNMWILWIGGGFPSKRFPETWDYNKDHRNIKENFVGALIDHGHERGIRTLLGLTPFGYDGVCRYGAAHPELAARDRSGKLRGITGIHCMGRWLCPSQDASHRFMQEYCRELWEDFYPNADGFFLESSDIPHCDCPDCAAGKGYMEKEWRFVRSWSRYVWAKKPDATILVYPQYAEVGAGYDPRHVIFIAPHYARGAERVVNPKVLWQGYWDVGLWWKDTILRAKGGGYIGVIPSMENFTFENPYGFDTRWGEKGVRGWRDILVRLTRLSFREYCRNPALTDEEFAAKVKGEFFAPGDPDQLVSDILTLHRHLNRWRGWSYRGGVMADPPGPEAMAKDPELRGRTEKEIRPALEELRAIRERARRLVEAGGQDRRGENLQAMIRIIDWILRRWR